MKGMNMRTMVAGLVAATILAGCNKEPDKAPASAPPSAESFAPAFDAKFKESCLASATQGGVSQADAAAMCGCVLDKVNQRFPADKKAGLKEEQLRPLALECAKSSAG